VDEVGAALIAIALLCAVFIPSAFITGISASSIAICAHHRRRDRFL